MAYRWGRPAGFGGSPHRLVQDLASFGLGPVEVVGDRVASGQEIGDRGAVDPGMLADIEHGEMKTECLHPREKILDLCLGLSSTSVLNKTGLDGLDVVQHLIRARVAGGICHFRCSIGRVNCRVRQPQPGKHQAQLLTVGFEGKFASRLVPRFWEEGSIGLDGIDQIGRHANSPR